jgi:Predicted integral membrane protein (DUF2269)
VLVKTLVRVPLIAAALLCLAWLISIVMPSHAVLRLLHVLSFVILGAGLIGVLVCDLRARRATTFASMVDAIEALLAFYGRVAVVGSLGVLLSGFSMVFAFYGWTALQLPWLAGMMVLFVFEFLEGHLIMKLHYVKLQRAVARARTVGHNVPELEQELRARLTTAAHFLDVPNLALIIALGVVRPMDWRFFAFGLAVVAGVTAWMTYAIPRRHPWHRFDTLAAT